jgi:hypothetical protein
MTWPRVAAGFTAQWGNAPPMVDLTALPIGGAICISRVVEE